MRTTFGLLILTGALLIANSLFACCGQSWTAPPPPPPPESDGSSGFPGVSPSQDFVRIGLSTTYRDTKSGDWVRPAALINDFGIYSFSALNGKVYYWVETNDGSVFMARY